MVLFRYLEINRIHGSQYTPLTPGTVQIPRDKQDTGSQFYQVDPGAV